MVLVNLNFTFEYNWVNLSYNFEYDWFIEGIHVFVIWTSILVLFWALFLYLFLSLFFVLLSSIADIPLRLVGSNLPYAGRVEVRYAGVWGVICPRQMNGSVFKVICRQLGYTDVLGDERLYRNPQYPYRQSRLYGKGNGPVWLSRVRCHGNETSLSQCQIDNPGEILWCSHHEALELMCRPRNFTPRELAC